jgi:hypothetical protein
MHSVAATTKNERGLFPKQRLIPAMLKDTVTYPPGELLGTVPPSRFRTALMRIYNLFIMRSGKEAVSPLLSIASS